MKTNKKAQKATATPVSERRNLASLILLLKEKGISQNELASILGVTAMTVSNWVTYDNIRLATLMSIADYFNLTLYILSTTPHEGGYTQVRQHIYEGNRASIEKLIEENDITERRRIYELADRERKSKILEMILEQYKQQFTAKDFYNLLEISGPGTYKELFKNLTVTAKQLRTVSEAEAPSASIEIWFEGYRPEPEL